MARCDHGGWRWHAFSLGSLAVLARPRGCQRQRLDDDDTSSLTLPIAILGYTLFYNDYLFFTRTLPNASIALLPGRQTDQFAHRPVDLCQSHRPIHPSPYCLVVQLDLCSSSTRPSPMDLLLPSFFLYPPLIGLHPPPFSRGPSPITHRPSSWPYCPSIIVL